MRQLATRHAFDPSAGTSWLPWWYRPSLMLLWVSLPSLLIFSFSDSTLTLSKASLFYGSRDMVVGIAAIVLLFAGALLGESNVFAGAVRQWTGRASRPNPPPRLAEAFLPLSFDRFLMAIFIVSHLIFFRNFFTNPGLIAEVLGGNVELKHTFKTIPGVTTWTQISLVLGAIRGLRWSGILPGPVKLISLFHIVFFGTLFVRAILWSERLAMIEGAIPFFICALPRVTASLKGRGRFFMRLLPIVVPGMLLLVFTAFESLRSWHYYAGQHASVFEFGWRRLYTYYFEAMNTGAAALGTAGFYDGLTGPLSPAAYESIYEGLYQGPLDREYNNVSGIWWVAARTGNVLFTPVFLALGCFFGLTWRGFVQGRLFGLFFPITFLGLMEIVRIPYWAGLNRVLPSTAVIVVLLIWGATLHRRVRFRTAPSAHSPLPGSLPHQPTAP